MASPLAQALAFQNAVNPAQSGISPTDVVGAYKLSSDVAEKNYQAQLAKANAMWGGLAGLGSAGIAALGPSLLKKYLGAGANAAAGASPAASVAAASDPASSGILTGGQALGLSPSQFAAGNGLADASSGFGVDALSGFGKGAGSVAADMGLGDAAAAGGVADASLAPAAAGSVATDMAALAPADAAVGDAAAASLPDWLASALPFLAFA